MSDFDISFDSINSSRIYKAVIIDITSFNESIKEVFYIESSLSEIEDLGFRENICGEIYLNRQSERIELREIEIISLNEMIKKIL